MITRKYIETFNEFVAGLEAANKPVVAVNLSVKVDDGEEVEITKAPGEWFGCDSEWEEPVCLPDFSNFPVLEAVWLGAFVGSDDYREPSCDSCLGQ